MKVAESNTNKRYVSLNNGVQVAGKICYIVATSWFICYFGSFNVFIYIITFF